MTPYSHTIWTELTLLGSLITSAVTVHVNVINAFVDEKKQNEFYFFIELQTIVTLHANLSIISIHARICTWQCGWIRIFYRKQESSCERNKQKTGDAHTHTHTHTGPVGWPRRARIQPAKRWADGPNKRVEYNFCATGRPKFSMQFLSFSSNNIWAKRVVLVLRSILLSRNIEIIDNRIIFGELDAKMLVKWFFKEKTPSSK